MRLWFNILNIFVKKDSYFSLEFVAWKSVCQNPVFWKTSTTDFSFNKVVDCRLKIEWFQRCWLTEAATEGVTWKKVFLKISQNSQGNTWCSRAFSCEFYEICKNIFFTEHLWTTASGHFFREYSNKNFSE